MPQTALPSAVGLSIPHLRLPFACGRVDETPLTQTSGKRELPQRSLCALDCSRGQTRTRSASCTERVIGCPGLWSTGMPLWQSFVPMAELPVRVCPNLVDVLWPRARAMGVRTLALRTGDRGEASHLEPLRGPPPPDTVRATEHGVPFEVDLVEGQKTGAFLDQRDNRRRFGKLADGRRVLNLFSYAGGFSVSAALGGAVHVTSVDIAPRAHATAQTNFRVAGLDPRSHAFAVADVLGYLKSARDQREKWDLIVSDPPSFAPNERALPRALSAYRTLHRSCVEVLAPGGIFCAASCSSHVDANAFLATLDDVALAGRSLRILELRGAGADHPTLAGFPEGRYLKFAVLG